jgi:hypothetical protein
VRGTAWGNSVMSRNCSECDRLWEVFVEATHSHLKLLSQQQIAVIKHDNAALTHLRDPVADSATNRQNARNRFREHAATHGDSVIPMP